MTKHVLKNGLTVLMTQMPHVKSVSAGIYVKTGSAYEPDTKAGMSHFLEHMLFKGTKNRTAKEVAAAIEGKGGMLNAYTDRGVTVYYAKGIYTEVDTILDVLADMYQNSLLAPEEIELEKKVVLEEISREFDDPDSFIHSLYISQRWNGSSWGRPILGTRETVSALTSQDLKNYVTTHYTAPNTVVSIAGSFDEKHVLEQVEKLFSGLSNANVAEPVFANTINRESLAIQRDVEQACFCIGFSGMSNTDERRHAMYVISTALGGEMYSRLFQEIREKRGLAYSVGTYTASYKHDGLLVVYGGTNYKNWDTVQQIVAEQIADITKNGLTSQELEMSKDNNIGLTMLSQERPADIMANQAYDEINHGRRISVEETVQKIKDINNDMIIEVAQQIFPGNESHAIIYPKSHKPGFLRGILGMWRK